MSTPNELVMAPITRSSSRRERDASSSNKPSRPNELVMASQVPYSPPMTRRRSRTRRRYSSSSDRLPTDVLSVEILQRFPAKDLCRLRTVCRSWRSIISDADFIRQHKEPFLMVKFPSDMNNVYVVDLNGNVVKRISGAKGGLQLLRTSLDLACLATEWNKCRVFNPATGGFRQVRVRPLDVIRRRMIPWNVSTFFALGFVASRREYKLLCCLIMFNHSSGWEQRSAGVHVLTINGGTNHSHWRRKPDPPLSINGRSSVVVDGVVYFLTCDDYDPDNYFVRNNIDIYGPSSVIVDGVPADCILSFDLAREEWRRNLHGPSSIIGNLTSGPMVRSELTLADLKGSLVLAHHPCSLLILDLWFLLDFESMLWVKQYNIRIESVTGSLDKCYLIIPLLALDDGRLVIHLGAPYGELFICDPGTNTFTRVNTRDHIDSVGVYTGSLLECTRGTHGVLLP